MTQTPHEYLSRHSELTTAALRTGRSYGRYCLALAALFALMLIGIGLIPLPQPAPVLLAVAVYLGGLAALTVWQVRRQRSWPRYLTPVHLGLVLGLTLVNAVAVMGGTGVVMPTGQPVPWFLGGALAALIVGIVGWLVVRRLSTGHLRTGVRDRG